MTKFLSPKDTCQRIALSRASLDRLVAARTFPAPIRLSERRIAFKEAEVETWMLEREAAR